MHDLEMEIGRIFGSSTFFIYQTIKHNPKSSIKNLEVETGLSDELCKQVTKRLLECGVVTREYNGRKYDRGFSYKVVEEKETWKFH